MIEKKTKQAEKKFILSKSRPFAFILNGGKVYYDNLILSHRVSIKAFLFPTFFSLFPHFCFNQPLRQLGLIVTYFTELFLGQMNT